MSEIVTLPFCFRFNQPEAAGLKGRWNLLGKQRKPWLHLCAGYKGGKEKLRALVVEHRVKVLNVAGPRASNEPGVGEFVMRTLEELFG
jgi:hypothetical protein